MMLNWRVFHIRNLQEGWRMDRIGLGTLDGAVENVNKLADLFPQVVTEVASGGGHL